MPFVLFLMSLLGFLIYYRALPELLTEANFPLLVGVFPE